MEVRSWPHGPAFLSPGKNHLHPLEGWATPTAGLDYPKRKKVFCCY
jgi:hypothetical protein